MTPSPTLRVARVAGSWEDGVSPEMEADAVPEGTAGDIAALAPDEFDYTGCHTTRASQVLLDTYAIETPICCGLTFEAHDATVTDHLVETKWLWNAQLHDLVDNIERQSREVQL